MHTDTIIDHDHDENCDCEKEFNNMMGDDPRDEDDSWMEEEEIPDGTDIIDEFYNND